MIRTLILIVGICMGSFVNAFVWRLKKKKNWITERSICTHCGHTLNALDLIPIVSYVLLRGRCRYCKKPIEDSPLIEFGVGISFLVSYIYWPFGFDLIGWVRLIIWFVAIVLLASMFIYDLKWTILPDKLTRSLFVVAGLQLVVMIVFGDATLSKSLTYLASVAIGGGIFHLIYEFSKGKYIGGGDVKLGYAYGLLLLDPLMSWMVLAIASLVGSVIAMILMIAKQKTLNSKLPFGPMLIVGVFISVLFGQQIWSAINMLMLY